jgi:hypothetical protein
MNKILYNQAKINIEKQAVRERKEKIKEEYQKIFHQSQMKKEDPATLQKIKKTYAEAKKVPVQSQGGAYIIHAVKNRLENYIEEKKYHSVTLRKIENYLKTKEWDSGMLEEKSTG